VAIEIRLTSAGEVETVRALEWAAGEVFRTVGLDWVAEDEPASIDELLGYVAGGRSWVAIAANGSIAAYVLVDIVDGAAHVEQLSVHPDHAHQRIGAALLDHVAAWALARDIDRLTLTTFRSVPWNAPYYERCGFRELTDDEIGPGLHAVMNHEAESGLALDDRTAMVRDLRCTHE